MANSDTDGDGFTAWQEYLCGTDPTDAESTFTADIRLENGVPVIGWSVTNNVRATYTVQGTSDLSKPFTAPTTSAHRFFRVIVTPK